MFLVALIALPTTISMITKGVLNTREERGVKINAITVMERLKLVPWRAIGTVEEGSHGWAWANLEVFVGSNSSNGSSTLSYIA